jgi:circadian clock protein KaiB
MEREKYKLCLYVSGQTQKSNRAIKNLQDYCREHMGENYSIEVIDLKEHPQLAEGEQIIATPALIKKLPEPMRVLVGDLSDKNKFLVGMNLLPV